MILKKRENREGLAYFPCFGYLNTRTLNRAFPTLTYTLSDALPHLSITITITVKVTIAEKSISLNLKSVKIADNYRITVTIKEKANRDKQRLPV